jgi:hypothetical protein
MAPVSLNIKNDAVVALARELAARLGSTQVSALEVALREKLERLDAGEPMPDEQDRRREIDTLLSRVWQETEAWPSSGALAAELYDENGLPA